MPISRPLLLTAHPNHQGDETVDKFDRTIELQERISHNQRVNQMYKYPWWNPQEDTAYAYHQRRLAGTQIKIDRRELKERN